MLHDVFSTPDITVVTKVRWKGALHVARMRVKKMRTEFFFFGGKHEDLGADGRIILKCIIEI